MPNVLLASVRKQILDEINSPENKARKNESVKRFDIYKKRQAQYIKEQLIREYSQRTVSDMRVISSINLGPRIIDKMASLYSDEPKRMFTRSSGQQLSENETRQINELYKAMGIDEIMKKSNRYFKLQQQAAIQLIPRDGKVSARVLMPHHYDVIPDDGNPEHAMGYVVSVYDRSLLYNQQSALSGGGENSNYINPQVSDGINQMIADQDDPLGRAGMRFIWWTAEWNFVTDGWGNLIGGSGDRMEVRTVQDLSLIENPIKMLPFIDIACGKDFEFWVRQGNDTIDFTLDFSVLLSDTAEINKRQGYSQAIVYSEEAPKDMVVGPNRVLHIKQNPDKELQPRFEWSNPQPDMQAALSLLETYLSLFLTSQGLDPKTVTGKGETLKFNSGFERLLAMIDMFEASKDDMSLYRRVEQETLKITAAWSNLFQTATIANGVRPFDPNLRQATIPEDAVVTVVYATPTAAQSQADVEDSQVKLLDNRLTSRKRAIMAIHKVDEDGAEKIIEEIDQEDEILGGGGNKKPPVESIQTDQPDPEDDPMMNDQEDYGEGSAGQT